jgi:predicted transposase YbfD/YdcC
LFREIKRVIIEQKPLDTYQEHEKKHSRQSSWYVSIFNARTSQKASEWKNLSRFIPVHKQTIRNGKQIYSNRFYISDESTTSAQYFHKGIRGHWQIENNLHWVKDVFHNEDRNAIRTNNGPVNSAIFSSISINIHRKNGNHSITKWQIKFGANVKKLFRLLRT